MKIHSLIHYQKTKLCFFITPEVWDTFAVAIVYYSVTSLDWRRACSDSRCSLTWLGVDTHQYPSFFWSAPVSIFRFRDKGLSGFLKTGYHVYVLKHISVILQKLHNKRVIHIHLKALNMFWSVSTNRNIWVTSQTLMFLVLQYTVQ